MPVKHALLSLLAERDLTGYELKVRFERALGDFWQLNSGQVYSTLARLQREGMVTRRRACGEPEASDAPAQDRRSGRSRHMGSQTDEAAASTARGPIPERARYAILPRGRRELERWFGAPVARLRPVRDPLYVKLVFSRPDLVPAVLHAFAAEVRRYTEATETLSALVAREPMSHAGRVRWLIAEAARSTYEAQLHWLETVRRTLAPPVGHEGAVAAGAQRTQRPPAMAAVAE